jgi:hypothetical protein
MEPNFTILVLANTVLAVHNLRVVLADLGMVLADLGVVLVNLVLVVSNFNTVIVIPFVGKLRKIQLHIWGMKLSTMSIQFSNNGYET